MTHAELTKLLDILDKIDSDRDEVEGKRLSVERHPYPTAYDINVLSITLFTRANQNSTLSNHTRAEEILRISKKVSPLSRLGVYGIKQ